MKKFYLAAVAAFVMVSASVNAQEYSLFEGGNDVISSDLTLSEVGVSTSYLWRGQELSGLNVRGDLSANFESGDFSMGVGTWFIHAFQESIYGPLMKRGYQEWDLYAYLGYGGLTLTVTDYMDNSDARYFSTGLSKGTGHAFDASLEYNFGENFPLTLAWNTILLGGDDMEEEPFSSIDKRYYSSYAEASYDFNIGESPIDFTASVGFIPWTSPYIDDAEGAHFSWLGLRAGYNIPFPGTELTLPVSTTIGLNPTDGRFLWSVAIGF